MKFKKTVLPLFLFALISICMFQTQAHAARNFPDTDFLLSPIKEVEQSTGNYRAIVKGGEQKKYEVFAKNLTKKPINLWLYPADSAPGKNGGKSYTIMGETNTSVGSWIAPSQVQKIQLKPNEIKKYTYIVNVPNDLKPGEYVGGIVAEQIPDEDQSPSGMKDRAILMITPIERIGVQIVIEKDKEHAVHEMSIDDFKHSYTSRGYSQLTVKLSNTGTILQRPNGMIMIRDANGKGIYSQSYDAAIGEKSIYGGKTANMVYDVTDQILWPGEYSAYFEANFNGKKVSRTFNFTVSEAEARLAEQNLNHGGLLQGRGFMDWLNNHPWAYVVGALVLIITLGTLWFFIILLIRKKKKEDEPNSSQSSRRQFHTT